MLKKLYSNRLREVRKSLSMNQMVFAQKANVTQATISQLENGHKEFLPTEIIQFLNTINVDLNWFFSEVDSETKPVFTNIRENITSSNVNEFEEKYNVLNHKYLSDKEHLLSRIEELIEENRELRKENKELRNK